jgi:hypothetical protein
MRAQNLVRLFIAALTAVVAQGHVGSPDVYLDGKAGPYQLFVTVRPPQVIPGVAELEIRSESPGVAEMRAVPVPIAGAGAKFAPVPDKLTRSKDDAQFFTGSLWMMMPGSWQVRVTVKGDKGDGVMSVPVPSAALSTSKMNARIGTVLGLLGVFLVGGLVAIAGASVREAKLQPGAQPRTPDLLRGRIAMAVTFAIVVGIIWAGRTWWNREAYNYSQNVYRPTKLNASLDRGSGVLNLQLADSNWLEEPSVNGRPRGISIFTQHHSVDDLVPDHNHLMHLYVIREPELDVVFHLHPDQVGPGSFRLQLPALPAGAYRVYADIVHANGFPETAVTDLVISKGLPSRPLTGDDASSATDGWTQSKPNTSFTLPDGYRMEWLRGGGPLHAKKATTFRFRLVDPQGNAPKDMALYMGMLGHAAFVKTDGSVFAHIHPMGTASMAALSLAQSGESSAERPATPINPSAMEMPAMNMQSAALPNEVRFPYGFPSPGRYRIFVQMKHGNTIETGVFDAVAE